MAIEFISGSTAEVEENVSTSIYTAQVTDTNESGGSISFELGEGSDPGLTIDPETGIVTVSNGLDYETKSSYSFTVIATNESGDSSEIQVTINVTNLDEADPTITSADLVSVNEGIGSDQVVYTATATDGNDISGGVVYSLAEGSDSVLSIDANSGAVTLTDDPDASTKDTYTFTVVATDAAGNSVSEDVTLRINRIVSGTEGNDTIANTSSNDVVSAGKGADVFSYSGNYDDYNVSLIAGGSVRVVNLASPSEVDVLSVFESLQFADRTINIQIVYTAGEDILVNTQASDAQYRSNIASLSDGGYVVVWQSANQDGSSWGVYGQRFDAAGAPVGSEFLVNTATSDAQEWPVVAGLSDGGYVVAWQSANQDGSSWGVYGQRYDADGAAVGDEFLVNDSGTGASEERSSIVGLADGGFIIVWKASSEIYSQRFDADGNKVGSQTQG